MANLNEYLAGQEAIRLADKAIKTAAGPARSSRVARPVVLATSFAKRSDLPEGTLICKLLPSVVKALSAIGLHEPVSLTVLPGKWWVANVDQAAEDPNFESGCCTVRVVVSTEQLQFHYGGYYCELIDGPFDSDKRPE
jgi:hypothetical protein